MHFALEYIICEMASILSWPWCVNKNRHHLKQWSLPCVQTSVSVAKPSRIHICRWWSWYGCRCRVHMLLHSHTVFLQSIINTLTHSPLEDVVIILKVQSLNTCFVKFLWTPQNTFYDESTLVWVMPWCHQAASHSLSQCWPRSMSPYVVTKPPWVKAHTKWPPLFL